MYGIANLSIIPMRKEQSERSEMVSQVLFGELFSILETTDKWVYIKLLHDQYEGWIDKKMYQEVTDEYAAKYQAETPVLTTELFNIVRKEGAYGNYLITSGSVLPFFNADNNTMLIGNDTYTLVTRLKDVGIDSFRELIIEYALMYHNTPYLWGGRTPYGIDCSGFTQIVYRMAGMEIPRDASQQVLCGQNFSFVEEALPGDLAFFGDDLGAITHVGIIWQENRIIHASGKVRIDKIDHQGIFNEDLKRYTHNLKVIKRLIID
ncbi:C40 family peptidase [Odoribacter lunatus]|uniref:C40 family peptidase n=1 Tax=Odoribacter lunatus TaxID=2941335 RepID=UPI00203EC6B4|nr:C40 family peptidase [Odoribacter lunatus]